MQKSSHILPKLLLGYLAVLVMHLTLVLYLMYSVGLFGVNPLSAYIYVFMSGYIFLYRFSMTKVFVANDLLVEIHTVFFRPFPKVLLLTGIYILLNFLPDFLMIGTLLIPILILIIMATLAQLMLFCVCTFSIGNILFATIKYFQGKWIPFPTHDSGG